MTKDYRDPLEVAKDFEIAESEEETKELADSLKSQGYEVKGVHAFKKEDIWEYLKAAKPQVLVMHNADPDNPTKVLSGLFIMDHEAVDSNKALQLVIQGALGDDVRNDAVHELFVKTAIAGLMAKADHDDILFALKKILGMPPSQAEKISKEADEHMKTLDKKHLN